jgi:hypothetical protein
MMPTMGKAIVLLLGVGVVGAIAAASNDGIEHREVAGHRFEIPSDYLFDARLAWLPAPEEDSFVFLFQPNSHPNQIPEHRILVEPLSGCPTDAVTAETQMLRIACGQEKPEVSDAPPYEKVQSDLGSWSSDLFAVQRSPDDKRIMDKRQVAYCQLFEPNPAKPKPSTLCTTFWGYKGMKLQFSFDETESSELPAMKAKAQALLDQWEVH